MWFYCRGVYYFVTGPDNLLKKSLQAGNVSRKLTNPNLPILCSITHCAVSTSKKMSTSNKRSIRWGSLNIGSGRDNPEMSPGQVKLHVTLHSTTAVRTVFFPLE